MIDDCEGSTNPEDLSVYIVSIPFWEEHNHMDDRHLGPETTDLLPESWDQVSESCFQVPGLNKQELRDAAIGLGMLELPPED